MEGGGRAEEGERKDGGASRKQGRSEGGRMGEQVPGDNVSSSQWDWTMAHGPRLI